MKSSTTVLVMALAVSITGCGDGNDPLKMLSTDPNTLPVLTLPVVAASITSIGQFNTSDALHDGIDLNVLTLGSSVRAPAGGVVTKVDSANGFYTVFITHNPTVSSRISKLQSTGRRVGDLLSSGDEIGVTSSSAIHFSVLVNAKAVCPMSYLDSDGRKQINLLLPNAEVCTQ